MSASHHYRTRNYAVGLLLLTLREKAGLTQTAVAGLIGVSEKAVYNWEAGSDYPAGMNLKKLIETYLQHNVFSPGNEREEARAMWEQVALHAPRRKAIFDEEWFTTLLHTHYTTHFHEQQDRQSDTEKSLQALNRIKRVIDWEHAPDLAFFCGRSSELTDLTDWILMDRCRVITLLGIGGIGKTALATRLTHQVSGDFAYVLWRSLKNAPPLHELLRDCITFFSENQTDQLTDSDEGNIWLLLSLFRMHRCLLVLDNVETILQAGSSKGQYRQGYEGYEMFIEQLARGRHQSCVLLTSREKLHTLGPLESPSSVVRSLQIKGLSRQESQELLQERTLHGDEAAWNAIVQAYAGNPLALKMVSEIISDLFDGHITHFLQQGEIYFNGIRHLLDKQIERLSPLEHSLLYWLAIERDQVSITELRGEVIHDGHDEKLIEALHALYRRSLLERGEQTGSFMLQPVVLEYITERLVTQVCREIEENRFGLLAKYALVQAQTREYIRASQVRLIIEPLVIQLQRKIGSREEIEKQLLHLAEQLRIMPRTDHGYGAGNLINILAYVKGDVCEADFSNLAIKGAYLQGIKAQGLNLSGSSIAQSVFTETFGSITSVAVSPDGRYIAAGSFTGEIRVWQLAEMKQLYSFSQHNGWIWSVAFSPDSMLLASASNDRTIKLWDVSNPESQGCIRTLEGHTHWVKTVAFSPDGSRLVSGSNDQTLKLWDVASGQHLATLTGHNAPVSSVAFNPAGTILASGSEDTAINLWNVEKLLTENALLRTLTGHTDSVQTVAFSPDGSLLASGSADASIKLWEMGGGNCTHTLQGHSRGVFAVAFAPQGGLLASGGADQVGKLWDIQTGQCRRMLSGHVGTIWSIAFHPDGRELVTGGDDQTVRQWQVKTGACLRTLHGYTGMLLSVTFCPNSIYLLSGGEDTYLRIWDSRTRSCLSILTGHEGRIWSVACSADGSTIASAGHDRTIRLWNTSGRCLHILHGHSGTIWSLAFSPDGTRLASGSEDGTIKLWDVQHGRCIATLHEHKHWVWSVVFNQDGTLLASGSVDRTVKVWNVAREACVATFAGHTEGVSAVAFHPNGALLISGSYDQAVKFWHLRTGECVYTLHDDTTAIVSLAVNSTGTVLICGGNDSRVKVWDISALPRRATLQNVLAGHSGVVVSVDISPDDSSIASSGEDGTIKIWSLVEGQLLKTLHVDRPYERMNIANVTGMTPAQKQTLRTLGASEQQEETGSQK